MLTLEILFGNNRRKKIFPDSCQRLVTARKWHFAVTILIIAYNFLMEFNVKHSFRVTFYDIFFSKKLNLMLHSPNKKRNIDLSKHYKTERKKIGFWWMSSSRLWPFRVSKVFHMLHSQCWWRFAVGYFAITEKHRLCQNIDFSKCWYHFS